MMNIYSIHVQGLLDDQWTAWLNGMVIQRQCDGTTVISGNVVDQAALHGVI